MKNLLGELNKKVGIDNTNSYHIMGAHYTGEQNENEELFTEFCSFNDLIIGGTLFPQKTIHKTKWISPDGKTENQIDHITIGRKWRRSLHDVRVGHGADAESGQHLVVAVLKTKLKAYRDRSRRPSIKFNVQCLRVEQKSFKKFKSKWGNDSVCSPYSQKRRSKNIGTACKRPRRWRAQTFWARNPENTKSGLHLTPWNTLPRERT